MKELLNELFRLMRIDNRDYDPNRLFVLIFDEEELDEIVTSVVSTSTNDVGNRIVNKILREYKEEMGRNGNND